MSAAGSHNLPLDAEVSVRTHSARRSSGLAGARVLNLVIATTIFVLTFGYYLSLVPDSPFHRDEARWVHRAVYLHELTDPLGPYWDEATWLARGGTLDEQYRLRNQPPLGSYLMGVGLLAQGRDLNVNGFWNMDQDNAWNIAQGNMPAEGDLLAARRTTSAVAALTAAAVYLIGARLTNWVGGITGAAFLAAHPLMSRMATFAGSDTVLVLTLALAAVAAYRMADRPTWPRAVLLGVLLGLGGAAKLSPLAVAAGIGAMGVALVALSWLTRSRGHDAGSASGLLGGAPSGLGWRLLTVPVVAGVTFVASYPYLWRAPVEHTRNLFAYRTTGMELQGSLWSGIAVDSPLEAMDRVARRLGEEFSLLERHGIGAGEIELWVGGLGLVMLAVLAFRRGLVGAHGLVLAVLVGQAAVVVLGMRVDWARYHLPILLLVAVCIGVAAGQVWMLARQFLRR